MDGSEIILSVLPTTIYPIAWIVALIFAIRMARSSGGRPEQLLLIGICLMLASSIIRSVASVLVPWLVPGLREAGMSNVSIAWNISAIHMFGGIISLTGIVLLVHAFWQKFKGSVSQ